MSNVADMSTPVTRGELKEELDLLRQEFRQAIAPLATKAELAPLATKVELEIWGGALLARIQSSEQGLKELKELIKASERQLQADLARHAGALFESMSALIKGLDEKYADLPGRVTVLETRVFGPGSR
jgi:hypothetical protein